MRLLSEKFEDLIRNRVLCHTGGQTISPVLRNGAKLEVCSVIEGFDNRTVNSCAYSMDPLIKFTTMSTFWSLVVSTSRQRGSWGPNNKFLTMEHGEERQLRLYACSIVVYAYWIVRMKEKELVQGSGGMRVAVVAA